MNAEHLLDAMGLLDDELIQEAETYVHKRSRPNYRPWAGLAACLAVALVLSYGMTQLSKGGGNSGAPGNAGGASSAPAGSSQVSGENTAPEAPGETDCESQAPGVAGSSQNGSADYFPAIMVDGVLYWSTGEAVPVEVDESAIHTVTAYINTVPQMDGQTNFSQDLSARYAIIKTGGEEQLVVLMDGEWVLFDPVPPWEG